jgi:hypothetical protein
LIGRSRHALVLLENEVRAEPNRVYKRRVGVGRVLNPKTEWLVRIRAHRPIVIIPRADGLGRDQLLARVLGALCWARSPPTDAALISVFRAIPEGAGLVMAGEGREMVEIGPTKIALQLERALTPYSPARGLPCLRVRVVTRGPP